MFFSSKIPNWVSTSSSLKFDNISTEKMSSLFLLCCLSRYSSSFFFHSFALSLVSSQINNFLIKFFSRISIWIFICSDMKFIIWLDGDEKLKTEINFSREKKTAEVFFMESWFLIEFAEFSLVKNWRHSQVFQFILLFLGVHRRRQATLTPRRPRDKRPLWSFATSK